MPQLFHPASNTVARLTVPALVMLGLGVLTSLSLADRADYSTLQHMVVAQPVPFSHRHHVGELGIDCRFCHSTVETSAGAGMPSAGVCMHCHSQLWTDADVLQPVRDSWQTGEPLQWSRVYDLPDFVYFDHSIHVRHGVGCSTCHGRVDRMALTERAVTLQMSWCLDCHEDPAGQLREPGRIYDLQWQPPGDPGLVQRYGIAVHQLTNCTVCHR